MPATRGFERGHLPGRMRFADREFEELVWSRPTHSSPDWVELGALLTPLGDGDVLVRDAIPLASAAATRRLLVVGYANRLPVRVVRSQGGGRRKVVQRHAEFDGDRREIRLRLRTAVNRLACGADWLGDLPDATASALALWRATLLSNGLVGGAAGSPFSLRVAAAARAAALCAAAESLELRPRLARGLDGLRLTLDPGAGERLITRLAVPNTGP